MPVNYQKDKACLDSLLLFSAICANLIEALKICESYIVSFYINFSIKRQNLPINLLSSGTGIFAIIATISHSDNGTFL